MLLLHVWLLFFTVGYVTGIALFNKLDDADQEKNRPLRLKSVALLPRGKDCEGMAGGMTTVAVPTQIYTVDYM
jgi:hypothetical protein